MSTHSLCKNEVMHSIKEHNLLWIALSSSAREMCRLVAGYIKLNIMVGLVT